MPDSARVSGAFALAYELHREQTRKGSAVPYITHLMSVAAIVGEFGGAEDQMIAALLHDAVEDQGGPATRARIAEQFGPRIGALVDACTDADEHPKPPWRERKEAFLARTRNATAEARLVIAADKLHNLRSLINDYRHAGESLWDRFSATRDQTLWYYTAVTEALSEGWEHRILDELRRTNSKLSRLAAKRAPR